MKSLIPLLLCLLLAACQKKTNNNNNNADSMIYIINGITDVSIKQTDSTILALGAELKSGTQEKITLSVAGLPANVTASFSAASGTPSFGTALSIKSDDAAVGVYALKLKGTTSSNAVKSYDLNLTITGSPANPLGCAPDFKGSFTSSYVCSPNGSESSTIDTTGVKNEIAITNFPYFPEAVKVNINCTAKTFTIPLQAKSNWEISGTGSFTDKNHLSFTYTVTGSLTYNCTNTMTR